MNSKTCIISYSDIIYDKTAIKLLLKAKGDIVILNNIHWRKIWKLRFKNPLNDLEKILVIKKPKKANIYLKLAEK